MKLGREINLTVELSKDELADVSNITIILHYSGGKKTLTIDKDYKIHLCHNNVPPPADSIKLTNNLPAPAASSSSAKDKPVKDKIFLFKRKKVVPYGMSVATESLDQFVRFFVSPRAKKGFVDDLVWFFLDHPEGKKFNVEKPTPWHVGLWLLLDPDGLAKTLGGKGITFEAIQYAFSGIHKQLEDRVKALNGIMPKPSLSVLPKKKRKYTKKRK